MQGVVRMLYLRPKATAKHFNGAVSILATGILYFAAMIFMNAGSVRPAFMLLDLLPAITGAGMMFALARAMQLPGRARPCVAAVMFCGAVAGLAAVVALLSVVPLRPGAIASVEALPGALVGFPALVVLGRLAERHRRDRGGAAGGA